MRYFLVKNISLGKKKGQNHPNHRDKSIPILEATSGWLNFSIMFLKIKTDSDIIKFLNIAWILLHFICPRVDHNAKDSILTL